nr:hypothetical protein [Brevibacterium sp.]
MNPREPQPQQCCCGATVELHDRQAQTISVNAVTGKSTCQRRLFAFGEWRLRTPSQSMEAEEGSQVLFEGLLRASSDRHLEVTLDAIPLVSYFFAETSASGCEEFVPSAHAEIHNGTWGRTDESAIEAVCPLGLYRGIMQDEHASTQIPAQFTSE